MLEDGSETLRSRSACSSARAGCRPAGPRAEVPGPAQALPGGWSTVPGAPWDRSRLLAREGQEKEASKGRRMRVIGPGLGRGSPLYCEGREGCRVRICSGLRGRAREEDNALQSLGGEGKTHQISAGAGLGGAEAFWTGCACSGLRVRTLHFPGVPLTALWGLRLLEDRIQVPPPLWSLSDSWVTP